MQSAIGTIKVLFGSYLFTLTFDSMLLTTLNDMNKSFSQRLLSTFGVLHNKNNTHPCAYDFHFNTFNMYTNTAILHIRPSF